MEDALAPGLLVAMPNLNDTFFQKSLILLCEYTRDSAFGVMINRSSHMQISDIFSGDERIINATSETLLIGGPVQPEFMWAVHSPDYKSESTTVVHSSVHLTPIQEMLPALADGEGPEKYQIGFGYSGWGAGQLDGELREGAWWVNPLDLSLVFETPLDDRWQVAIESLGFNPMNANFANTGEA